MKIQFIIFLSCCTVLPLVLTYLYGLSTKRSFSPKIVHILNTLNFLIPAFLTWAGVCLLSYNWAIDAHLADPIRAKHYYYTMSVAALIATPVLIVTGKAQKIVASAILTILAIALYSDKLFFRFFGTVIPLQSSNSANQISDILDSVLAMVETSDIFILILLLVTCINIARVKYDYRNYLNWVGYLAIACCTMSGYTFVSATNDWHNKKQDKRLDHAKDISKYGIYMTHAMDYSRNHWLAVNFQKPSNENMRRIQGYFYKRQDERREAGYQDLPTFGIAKGMNVIYLQLEGFQEWLIDAKAFDVEITPFLNSIKKKSIFFDNIYDQTGLARTSACEYISLNSLHALGDGSVANRFQNNTFKTVLTTLKDEGYSTMSGHAYHRGMWNRAIIHPKYGYDRSFFQRELGDGTRMGWGLEDKKFFKNVMPHILETKEPFMVTLITLTSHHPYNYIPVEQRTIQVGALGRYKTGHYVYSARYVDEAVEQFFGYLKEAGLKDNTVIVMFGDHDSRITMKSKERFLAKQVLDVPDEEIDSLSRLRWRTDKVPVWIHFPDSVDIEPHVEHNVGGLVDLSPTVLHYMGVEQPVSMIGTPIIGELGPEMITKWNGSFVTNDIAYTQEHKPNCHERLTGRALPKEICHEYIDSAEYEVQMSLWVTRSDLAHQL